MLDIKFEDIIEPKYKEVGSFSEGFAKVRNHKNLWGYINKKGVEVIPCEFTDAKDFSEGYAAVSDKDRLYGYINKEGKLVIPCSCHSANEFSEGLARVSVYKNKYFIDKQGNIVLSFDKDVWIKDSFHEGLAIIEKDHFHNNKNSLMSYIDKYSNVIASFDECTRFKNGQAKVSNKTDEMIYLINTKGEILKSAPNKDNNLSLCFGENNELNRVILNNADFLKRYGFIDNDCNIKYEGYSFASDFIDGVAIVRKDLYNGFVSLEKECDLPSEYCSVSDFSEGLALVSKRVGDYLCYGYIDKEGREVIPCNYKYAYSFSEGLALVCDKDNSMYYINNQGEKVISILNTYKTDLYIGNNKYATMDAESERELFMKKLQLLESIKREVDNVKDEVVIDNIKKLKRERNNGGSLC